MFPLVVTGIGQVAFNDKADGSIVERNGKVVGLVAHRPGVHRPRRAIPFPSTSSRGRRRRPAPRASTAAGYDPTLSSGSNLGPTNPDFLKEVAQRVKDYRKLNGLSPNTKVPVDAVTASGSGLDPDISVANARLQAPRVADERGISVAKVNQLDRRPHGRVVRSASSARRRSTCSSSTSRSISSPANPRPSESVGFRHGTRDAPHLPRGRARASGKTFAMLNEGWRRASRGHRRRRRLRRDPRSRQHPGADRRPRGRAPSHASPTAGRSSRRWTSTPSSPASRRWRWSTSSRTPTCPVRATRSAGRTSRSSSTPGIDVISTVNMQHLESMNDVVEQITGIKQRETIPDAVVRAADQIEIVDMTPEALRRRMAHGNIYPAEKVDAVARQLLPRGQPRRAARARADVGRRPGRRGARGLPRGPRHRAHRGRRASGSSSRSPARPVATTSSAAPPGWPLARAASSLGVHVRPADGLRGPLGRARSARSAAARRSSAASTTSWRAPTSPTTLVQFARAENATQIVLGASRQSRWTHLLRGSVINNVHPRVGRDRRPRDLVGGRRPHTDAGSGRCAPSAPDEASRSRRAAGCWRGSLAIVAPPLLTLVLANVRGTLTLPSDLLMFLLVVVVVAALGGFVPGVRVRDHRVPARELVLHAAATRVHDRRGREPPRARDLPARRRGGEPARRDRVAAHGRGGAGARRGGDARRAERHAGGVGGPAAATGRPAARSRSRPTRVAVLGDAGDDDVAGAGAARATSVPTRPDDADVVVPLHGDDVLVLCGAGPSATTTARCSARSPARWRSRSQQRELRADADAGRRAGRGQRAAHRAAGRGVARPAHAAVVDQGVGEQPAAARRRLHAGRDPGAARDHRRGGRPAQPPRRATCST